MSDRKHWDQVLIQIKLPLSEENFPESGEEWQIIVTSQKLLDAGAKHARKVVGMDARWKNTDLRRPLAVLTGVCKDRSAFPIAEIFKHGNISY